MRAFRLLGIGLAMVGVLLGHSRLGNTNDWSNARGGADRDGHRAGKADLQQPQVYWVQRLGGALGAGSLWAVGNGDPAAYVSFGGRVYAKTWGDSTRWSTDLLGVTHVIARTDLDQDGLDDAVVAISGDTSNPAIAILDLNGLVLWTAPRSDLGPLGPGVRIVDLDGDGMLDVYATPWREGFAGRQAIAYTFADGVPQGTELWKLDADHRDYFGGFYDVVAEIDGTPGLELVSLGNRRVYTYDAASGQLESESEDVGPLPFARATLRPIDVDLDGVMEVLAYSNEAWAASNNRRHVSLFAWDTDSQSMSMVWTRDVADVVNDRIAFADNSGGDLDSDDRAEVVFGVFDAQSDEWVTEARDAATGALLDTLPGERFEAVVEHPLMARPLVFTHDAGQSLRVYSFDRTSGFAPVAALGDLGVASCRVQSAILDQAPASRGCVITTEDGDPAVVLTRENAATGRVTGLEVADLASGAFQLLGTRDVDDDESLSAVWAITGVGPARIAVAETSGAVRAYDASLRVPPATVKPPYSWGGIPYATKFSGADVPSFPLAVQGPEDAERVLTLSGAAGAVMLDASDGGSVAGGAEVVWRASGATRAVALNAPDPVVALFDNRNGIVTVDAEDGSERWRVDGLFDTTTGLLLNSDPLRVDAPDSVVSTLWFHRRDSNRGAYDLTVLDASSGVSLHFEPELDINNSGWRRLSVATALDGTPSVLSGRLSEVWRFDAATGAVASTYPVAAGSLSIPVPRSNAEPALLSIGLDDVSLLDPGDGSVAWQTPLPNHPARYGGVLAVGGSTYYATAEADTSLLHIMNLDSGAIETTIALNDGAASTDIPAPSAANGVLFNATAVDDLFGDGTAAWLVGSTDGYLYAISAESHELLWAVDIGAAVGEVVTSDWDGDGVFELVVSGGDGTLLGIDGFVLAAPGWVYDTDPPGGVEFDDVDTIQTADSLHAIWASVEGAVSYQVAVFTNEGERVTDGFLDVGNVTGATVMGLDLEVGSRYVFSVRAVAEDGSSVDTLSDGVTIVGDDVPGEPVGGCCDTRGRDSFSGWLVMMFAVMTLFLRRRR